MAKRDSRRRAASESVVALTEPLALRAYAHPLRLRLVGLLRQAGALTATQAAAELGESSGSTSFHLRQLAKYGLVERAGGGTGRERPWRATTPLTGLPDFAEAPELAEASDQLRAVIAARYHELLLEWIARSRSEPEAWQRAAVMSDRMLYLTLGELRELGDAIERLIEPFSNRVLDATARPPSSRLISFVELLFPADR